MTTIDMTGASDAEFRARVAAFDAAPTPPEVVVETVARAVCDSDWETSAGWAETDDYERGVYRRLAAAAIAALPPSPAEEAVKRVEAVADQLDAEAEVRELRATTYPPSGPWALDHNRLVVRADTFRRSARRLRAALASPLAGQHTADEEPDRG